MGSSLFSDDEIQCLRTSFALTKPVGAKAAEAFFANFFEASPELGEQFSTTKGPPKSMLWATLALVIDNIDDLSALELPMANLGERHAVFGANFENYAIFADVLIGTIATICDADWSNSHEDAWEKLLGWVVDTMHAAANEKQAVA